MTDLLRKQLIDTAMTMKACGFIKGITGNLSTRCGEGMLITPSGMEYDELSLADIVQVDFSGANQVGRKPSSEWRFHAAIYRNHPEANAVFTPIRLHALHWLAWVGEYRLSTTWSQSQAARTSAAPAMPLLAPANFQKAF
jgi:ribulose-5-phosphate 4-epimerase/fuculose-1-phosphate aldolase